MHISIGKERALSELAFLYWFFENAKYGLCMLLFGNQLTSLYAITGFSVIGILLASSLLILILALKSKRIVSNKLPSEAKLLSVFVIFQGVSLLWAEKSELDFMNFLIWGNILVNFIIFMLLFRHGSINELANKSLKGYILGATLTLVITLLIHPLESEAIGRLGMPGILDATRLGRIMVFGIVFSLFYLLKAETKKQFNMYVATVLLMICTLVAAFAKVALISTMLTVVVMLGLSGIQAVKRQRLLLLTVLGSFVVLAGSYTRFIGYTQFQGASALQTLSGRTIMWEVTWEMIKENPILGYGAGSRLDISVLPDFESRRIDLQPTQCPNELLNIWMQYGLLGLFLTISIYILLFRRAYILYKMGDRSISVLFAGLMVSNLLRAQFDADLIGLYFGEPMLLLFAFWMHERTKNIVLSRAASNSNEPVEIYKERTLGFIPPPVNLRPQYVVK